jgi:hypothetical protein
MEKELRIIVNQIRTPDGTVLRSMHRHDYVEYTDKNGLVYMVDGGTDYLRRNVHTDAPYEELTIYDNAPFEIIRENYCRGGRGKNGDQPLTWVPISQMSDTWLAACISYNEEREWGDGFANRMYKKEQNYRELHKIEITE